MGAILGRVYRLLYFIKCKNGENLVIYRAQVICQCIYSSVFPEIARGL